MATKSYVLPIPLTNIDSSTFTGSYQAINPNGLPFPCFLIRIINASNRDVTVSFDGTHDQEFVPLGTSIQLPFQSNAQPNNFAALLSAGTKVYVKAAAGAGKVYLAGYYQPTQ